MTSDPYPDLAGAEPPEALLGRATGAAAVEPSVRAQLSEADSRLLDALTRPAAHVVTAAEDDLLAARVGHDHWAGPLSAAARGGPMTPVFQEPIG